MLLKKSYSGSPPKQELPVLETLLYAICLENSTPDQAGAVYARLLNAFHDLNEVRVSSISELQPLVVDLSDPEWRAARVKSSLQYVFETNYAFDFESLRRKTADLATKQLSKIPSLSSFVRAYVMQHCLGSHVLPLDDRMHAVLVWLNFLPHWAVTPEPDLKLACFSTSPAIDSRGPNLLSEALGTFVLILVVAAIGSKATGTVPPGLGPYLVGMLVWAIGLSLGGTTGYAINPARDLGPRIVHAILPIPKKGLSNWSYAPVPVIGPLVGGSIAGLVAKIVGF